MIIQIANNLGIQGAAGATVTTYTDSIPLVGANAVLITLTAIGVTNVASGSATVELGNDKENWPDSVTGSLPLVAGESKVIDTGTKPGYAYARLKLSATIPSGTLAGGVALAIVGNTYQK